MPIKIVSKSGVFDVERVISVSSDVESEQESVFVKSIEVFSKPDFSFICGCNPAGNIDAYGYEKDNYGSVTPSDDNWKPRGIIDYIDARYISPTSTWFHFASTNYSIWKGWGSINVRAKSETGDEFTLTDIAFSGKLYNKNDGDGSQVKKWYDFLESNSGKKVSVLITDATIKTKGTNPVLKFK